MAIENIGGTDIEVVRLDNTEEHVKAVIQKRMEFAAERLDLDMEDILQIEDSGYKAICNVSQCSIGLALETTRLAMNYLEKLGMGPPYVINSDVIQEMGLTYEILCEQWDNPLRKANIIYMDM